MAIQYGVLRGHPDRYKREDNASTPHLQIRVLENGGQPWRIAVNVQSDSWFQRRVLGGRSAGGTSAAGVASIDVPASGAVARKADHALDYVKAPLFDWKAGRLLPPSGSASSDDLQDLLSLYLDQCKNAGGEIYAFGAKFDQNLHKPIDIEFGNTDGLHGIHDIHLTRAMSARMPGTTACFTTAGSSSRFPIDISACSSDSRRSDPDRQPRAMLQPGAHCRFRPDLSPAADDRLPPTPARFPAAVYIERALINPSGTDPGHEVVVLASLATIGTNTHELASCGQERTHHVHYGDHPTRSVRADRARRKRCPAWQQWRQPDPPGSTRTHRLMR